jgi:hypothetical protein
VAAADTAAEGGGRRAATAPELTAARGIDRTAVLGGGSRGISVNDVPLSPLDAQLAAFLTGASV